MKAGKSTYQFHKNFIIRAPLLPLETKVISEQELFDFSRQAFFKEAIYLASPILYDELIKWHNGQLSGSKEIGKLKISIYKYYTRMQSRCTPYGLFAACTIGEWNDKDNITLSDEVRRHTRLDMNFLCALAIKLTLHPSILPRLRFYPNNSIYTFGGQLRFVEYNYVNNRRIHQISSVENTEYLSSILECAEKGATIGELAQQLIKYEVSEEEARAFIAELIACQILSSELEPSVTGLEFIYQLIEILSSINKPNQKDEISTIIKTLENADAELKSIDKNIGNEVSCYRRILNELSKLGINIEENQLFQTDLFKSTKVSTLESSWKISLLQAFDFLNRISAAEENQNLKKFKENFLKQYSEAEVPVLEALDTETGVGYLGKDTDGINPLLDDLYFPWKEQNHQLSWNSVQKLFHDKILESIRSDRQTIEFGESDLGEFPKLVEKLPDSLSIMFKIVDQERIYIQNCGGSSAGNLISRFAHGDSSIRKIIDSITMHEKMNNRDKILAEIVHLPESRVGNILLRPSIREYEIPYMGKSALPQDNQIMLRDILVSVKNDKIILRSKKDRKEIIPKLTTAHNYAFNALPVYHFLCDLQTQYNDKSYLGFNWGSLAGNYKFLPRAEFKKVILSRARWQLDKEDFELLPDSKSDDCIAALKAWLHEWKIPDLFCLVDNDNELLVNSNSSLSVKMFLSTIKKREKIIIEEFLFDSDNLIVQDSSGKGYTNEFVAILLREMDEKISDDRSLKSDSVTPATSLIRNFHVGSEWLYYKLYCGIKTADKILIDAIYPLYEALLNKGLITKFFFIRYVDPDTHLRVRFLLNNTRNFGEVVNEVNEFIRPFITENFIHKIQLETYSREIERYGTNTMEISESLFCADSISNIRMLALISEEEGENLKWQFSIRSIDELLDCFDYNLDDKFDLFERLKESFIREHGDSKELRLQLDAKFRNLRSKLEYFLGDDTRQADEMKPLFDILDWKKSQVRDMAKRILEIKSRGNLDVDLKYLVSSYIHMMVNRIFKSKQRTFEMVLYDFLCRYYKSRIAREKKRQMTLTPNK
ncbi:MAG: lantibiotic dehydratase [Bacteroidia bacterium]